MTTLTAHRLDGLEPDNLLAFMAMLGLLRVLEESRPGWLPRVSWTVDMLPMRPALQTSESTDKNDVADAAVEGLHSLAQKHDFGDRKNLAFSPEDAAKCLRASVRRADQDHYTTDLWAALFTDAAVQKDENKVIQTPLCFMSGQGHQYFLARLARIPREPLDCGRGRNRKPVSAADCLSKALFEPWHRFDHNNSFRWDPHEDVRYAYCPRNPTDRTTKETTQHGANQLAAIGFSVFTVVPSVHSGRVSLNMLGSYRENNGRVYLLWPIWRDPISLAGIRALLGHPDLHPKKCKSKRLASLGVLEVRCAERIDVGRYRYRNVSYADSNFTQ